jgi:hypothetical protein
MEYTSSVRGHDSDVLLWILNFRKTITSQMLREFVNGIDHL